MAFSRRAISAGEEALVVVNAGDGRMGCERVRIWEWRKEYLRVIIVGAVEVIFWKV